MFLSINFQPQISSTDTKVITHIQSDENIGIKAVREFTIGKLQPTPIVDLLSHIKKNSNLTGVLINTLPRSGSNFVLDMFKSHPKTLWKPEPFVCVHEKTKLLNYDVYPTRPTNNVCAKQGALFLQGLFTCQVPSVDLMLNVANCSKGYEFDCNEEFKKAFDKCGLRNKSPRWCLKRFTHTIVKDNLRAAPSYLEEYALSITEEVKVVHLIRDPRSRAQSMKTNHQLGRKGARKAPLSKFRTILDRDCNTTMRDVKFGLLHMKPKKLYQFFRYEDTCFDLEEQTKQIMKFSGLEYVDTVKKWVEKSLSVKNVTHEQLRHLYNLDRVVHKQINKWRTLIDPELLRVVEDSPACQEMMKFFGYKAVGEDIETLRNTSIPLYTFTKLSQ